MTTAPVRPSRWPILLDLGVTLLAVTAVAFLVIQGPLDDTRDLIPRGRRGVFLLGCGALLAAVVLPLARPRRRPVRWLARLVVYPIVVVIVMVAVARARTLADLASGSGVAVWPPRPEYSFADRLDQLSPRLRAYWGVRIAAHQLGHVADAPSRLVLPPSWPFPDDVEVGFRQPAGGPIEIWARAADGSAACLRIPARTGVATDTATGRARCERRDRAPSDVAFAPVIRASPPAPTDPGPIVEPAWRQYRADARRSGVAVAPVTHSDGWRVVLDDQVRASVSVVGRHVLVGSHGIGHVVSLALDDGDLEWQARAANWVHQDPVTDGRVVVAGFGSDWGSFDGREPSGVAAWDLATGHHLWSRFDESGVMTTGVVRDSVIVYGTAAGVLRKRLMRTGELLAETRLPGGVIMAPPAMIGDTVVVTLDERGVCALLIDSFERLWCREYPGYRLMGHASPGVQHGVIVASGAELLRALSPGEFLRQGPARQFELLRTAFGPEYRYAAQSFLAIRVRDGALLWTSRAFIATKTFKGHIAGTATFADTIGVIALPLADSVVAFSLATGQVRWTAGSHDARGPPLLLGDAVVVAGRDGLTEIRALDDGTLRCVMERTNGYDRGGPTLAGDLVIFASLGGEVEAVPRDDLLECRGPGLRTPEGTQ